MQLVRSIKVPDARPLYTAAPVAGLLMCCGHDGQSDDVIFDPVDDCLYYCNEYTYQHAETGIVMYDTHYSIVWRDAEILLVSGLTIVASVEIQHESYWPNTMSCVVVEHCQSTTRIVAVYNRLIIELIIDWEKVS